MSLTTPGRDASTREMSGRERIEAALRFEPVDRIPWAPKVFIGHYRSGREQRYQDMTVQEFARVLHCDAIAWDHLVTRKRQNVEARQTRRGNEMLTVTETPVGSLRAVSKWSDDSRTWHPAEYPIKGKQDYGVAKYIAEHTSFEPNDEPHAEMLKSTGDSGVVMSFGDGTPLMDMIQGDIGSPEVYYHIGDYPNEFDELYEIEFQRYCRYYEAYAKTAAQYIVTHENTSSSLLSPALYEKYCLPVKRKFRDIVKKAGKTCVLHMCGTLKVLMPLIRRIEADCWESFTPPPNGDTYFWEGRDCVGDSVSLIGGMNAPMLTQWPEDRLLAYVDETIDRLPHTRGLIFTSGGAMAIECPLEKLAGLGIMLAERLRNVKN